MGKGYLIYTVGKIKGVDLGFSYSKGIMSLLVPRNRKDSTPRKYEEDPGLSFVAGEIIDIPMRNFVFDCDSMNCFMQLFFENRKCMNLPCDLAEDQNWHSLFKIQEEKFNRWNYSEQLQAYLVGVVGDSTELQHRRYQAWQPGWTGGAMSSYPLMKLGNAISYERGMSTLNYLFSTQKESGFFVGVIDIDGVEYSDGFSTPGTQTWHFVRKSADVLYFLFKHFKVIEEKGGVIPTHFLEGTKRLASAFAKLWKTYGQFGQFVSHETGEIMVGGSTSAAIAPAGLVMAARWFNDLELMTIAKESAQYYYKNYLEFGCTTGGAGDMLSCPDSESAFGLLESMIVLYENTQEATWLTFAKDIANYCSTWVMGYNYEFPAESEFKRLGIKTVGSVFANAQNKHSAPGICTLSGDSLYKLYKYTGEIKYFEMIQEIALNIFQYLSTNEKPIRAKEGDTYRSMPQGYMNERVNTSDWEDGRVGEIFYGSTWAETVCMLTIAELNKADIILDTEKRSHHHG
jgi:hypothetical protein